MTEKKESRGRPEYCPTKEDRKRVEVLTAQGMSKEAVAVALDVSLPTLRKAFFSELECGCAKVTAEIMEARYKSAMGGSVPAQNKLLELAGAIPASNPHRKRTPVPPKLGKKEQAQLDAENAGVGSEWGSDLEFSAGKPKH